MNDTVTIRTRKFMTNHDCFSGNKWSSMFFTLERQQYLKQKFEKNWPKCTRPHQMSSLYLDSELILVVARPTGFGMIYDSLDYAKKNRPKHRLARHGLYEKKRPQENSERNAEQEWRKSEGLQSQRWCSAKEGVKILQWLYLWWLCRFSWKRK